MQVLYEGALAKNNAIYQISYAEVIDCFELKKNHELAIEALGDNEKGYLLPKSLSYFENHINSSMGKVIKCTCNGEIIAQSIVHTPRLVDGASGVTEYVVHPSDLESLTVLQGVVVRPEYRGNGIGKKMIDLWLKEAIKEQKKIAIAEVSASNFFSWQAFTKNGVLIVGAAVDPDDGEELFHLEKDLSESSIIEQQTPNRISCVQNFVEAKKMLDTGFKGIGYDPMYKSIQWRPLVA